MKKKKQQKIIICSVLSINLAIMSFGGTAALATIDSNPPSSVVEQEPQTPTNDAQTNEKPSQPGDDNNIVEDVVDNAPSTTPGEKPVDPSNQDDTTTQQPDVTDDPNVTEETPETETPESEETTSTDENVQQEEEVNENNNAVTYWSNIPQDSNRYLLKAAAERMLGWNYSQALRMTPGFRDCSSFVYTAIADAGMAPQVSWAWTTYTMPYYSDIVEQISWSEIQPGDIVLGDGHVAFYWGNDAQGYPMTLECCGTYGVTYGYMMCKGWTFPYTSVWRIKGINNSDPIYPVDTSKIPYVGFDPNYPSTVPQTPTQSNTTSDAAVDEWETGEPVPTEEIEALNTIENVSYAAESAVEIEENTVVPTAVDSITITPEKLAGETLDLLDLQTNPLLALELFLDKQLTQIDLDMLQQLSTDDEKINYLVGKLAQYKSMEMAKMIGEYLGITVPYPENHNKNDEKSHKGHFDNLFSNTTKRDYNLSQDDENDE